MSWFSEEHKKIYSQAWSAFYDDLKSASNSIISTTGKYVNTGYEKIVEGANYLDKKYNTSSPDNNNNNEHNDHEHNISNISEISDINLSNIDDYDTMDHIDMIYPDVLIKLHKTLRNITKIFVLKDGKMELLKGKIDSYKYVAKIIRQWFIYERKNNTNMKWYPKDELYTAYRESSTRLGTMDDILFRYDHVGGYLPYHYHPLL